MRRALGENKMTKNVAAQHRALALNKLAKNQKQTARAGGRRIKRKPRLQKIKAALWRHS